MNNPYRLNDRVALVTGGSSGIGLAIARKFADAGARVVITGRDGERLEEARGEIGESCLAIRHDMTEMTGFPGFAKLLVDKTGPPDVLVNNAGMHQKKESLDVTDEEFERVLRLNLMAVFALTREILRTMIPRKRGSVINISSMAALYGLPRVAAYSSSKSGITGLTRGLASEYSHTGIRFNAIAPGFIETPLFLKAVETDPERRDRILARTPMGRLGTPEDIAHAALFLASDASRFITGICMPVDGGNSIGF